MYNVDEVSIFVKALKVYSVVTNKAIRDKYIEYYTFIFDTPPQCAGCPNEIEAAIQKLNWVMMLQINNGNSQLLKAKVMTKYTMNPKVRVMSSSLGIMVTQYNCTDAIAEALIKENPKNIALFTLNVEEGRSIVNVEATTTSTEKLVEATSIEEVEPVKEFVFEVKDFSKKRKRK
jgi:copper chaperone CopZ